MPTAHTSVVPVQVNADPNLQLFAERVEKSGTQDMDRKQRAPENWQVYDGDPWAGKAQAAKRKIEGDDGTPATSVNLVAPQIDAVAGDQRVNRREVKFKPQDLSQHDDVIAKWNTTLVRYFFGRSGHDIEASAILEQLVGAIGWMGASIGHESNGSPTIVLEWVPDFQMKHDTSALVSNLRDQRWQARRTSWDHRDAIDRWPEKKELIMHARGPQAQGITPVHTVNLDAPLSSGTTTSEDSNYVQVWEYNYYRDKSFVAWEDATGLSNLPAAEFEKTFPASRVKYKDLLTGIEGTVSLKEFADLKGKDSTGVKYEVVEDLPTERPKVHWRFNKKVFFTSKILRGAGATGGNHEGGTDSWLERPTESKLSLFPYVAITAFWAVVPEQDRVERKGLVDRTRETQLLIAKLWTQTVQMLAKSAKGGGFFNVGLFASPADFNRTAGQPGKWHGMKRAAESGDIVPNLSPSFPSFHAEMLTKLYDAMQMQSNVSQYDLGTEQRERSNVLVQNMQAQSSATRAGLTDPVESARTIMGQLIMELVQHFIPATTIMRILGEDAEIEGLTWEPALDETGQPVIDPQTNKPARKQLTTAAQMIQDRSVAEFDVVVDTGEASANERDAILNVMGQLMPTVMELPEPMRNLIFAEFVRALPMPKGEATNIAEDFKRQMEEEQAMKTQEGLMAALEGLPPEELAEIQAFLEQLLPPPEEEQPPQGPPAEAPIQ